MRKVNQEKTDMKSAVIRFVPESAKPLARRIKEFLTDSPTDRYIKRIKSRPYAGPPLLPETERGVIRVKAAAHKVYGDHWNFQSDALRPEMVKLFEVCVRNLAASENSIRYLEIGSCQGLSLSIIANLIKDTGVTAKIVSIDPYFSEGYAERQSMVPVNKLTKEKAFALYHLLGIDVEHLEDMSSIALKWLLAHQRTFSLVYVDGSHEGLNPLRDLALSLELLSPGGIVMLDDHQTYADVRAIKEVCDRTLKKVAETWKVAAYQVP